MPDFRTRRAVSADLEALLTLENASFSGDRLSRRQLRRHLVNASAELRVAAAGGMLLGAALLLFRRGSRVARLYSIAVTGAARGRGVGSELLRACERAARRRSCRVLRLEVRTDNVAAKRMYEGAGYRPIGRRLAYYEDGAEALRYEKSLD